MTIEEKLQNFYDLSVASAKQDSDEEIAAYREKLESIFSEHREEKQKQAKLAVSEEEASVTRELNKSFSARQIALRHKVSEKQDEVRDALFSRVREKLDAKKSTPDYVDFLCRKIRQAVVFAGRDEMHLYIDPSDEGLVPEILRETGQMPMLSDEPFYGGVRAVIPSRHILIDNSFLALLGEARRSFSFEEVSE